MALEKKTYGDPLKASMKVCFTFAALVLTSALAKGCTIATGDRDNLCDRQAAEPYCRFNTTKGFAPASNPVLIRSCKPCRDIRFCKDRQPYSTVAGVRGSNPNDIQCHTNSLGGRQEGRCAIPQWDVKNIKCEAFHYKGSGGTHNAGPELKITWKDKGWNEVHMHMRNNGHGWQGSTARRDWRADQHQGSAKHTYPEFLRYEYLYDACKNAVESSRKYDWSYGSSDKNFLPLREEQKSKLNTQASQLTGYIFF